MPEDRPLRLLHVTRTLDALAGGPPRSTARLAAAQAMLGHQVALISGGPRADDERVQDVLSPIPGIDQVQLLDPIRDRWSPLGSRKTQSVRQIVEQFDVVTLHGFWRPIFHYTAIACRQAGTPYILAPKGNLHRWSLGHSKLKKRLAMAVSFRRIIDRSLYIHALTEFEAASIHALFGPIPVEIIPNGIFAEEFESHSDPDVFLGKFPALRNRRLVLFMSRLHRGKGLTALIDSVALQQPTNEPYDLVIAGPDTGLGPRLRARVATLGLNDRIHFTGPLYGRMKASAMAAATCFCLPSRQEGFSMAILEAMAAGLPVVITDACHFPAAIEAGAGIECTTDPESIAAALTTLLSSPEMARQFGDSGRRLVSERFSWPTIAERSIEIIRSHLNRVAICP